MSKRDEGKPRLSLVYRSLVEQIALVRMYGLTKYPGEDDWRTTEPRLHMDACLRHVFAHLSGEYLDQTSKLPHLAHAAANLMFEIERTTTSPVANSYQTSKYSLCTTCRKNFVDAEAGYDTCESCRRSQ